MNTDHSHTEREVRYNTSPPRPVHYWGPRLKIKMWECKQTSSPHSNWQWIMYNFVYLGKQQIWNCCGVSNMTYIISLHVYVGLKVMNERRESSEGYNSTIKQWVSGGSTHGQAPPRAQPAARRHHMTREHLSPSSFSYSLHLLLSY